VSGEDEKPRKPPRRPRSAAGPLRRSVLHVDARGRARMVDVGGKGVTRRIAVARGALAMSPQAFEALSSGRLAKGDAIAVARVAGIQAAKRTSEIVPLCHPLALESVEVEVDLDRRSRQAVVTATARITGKTGVEMEALTAVSVACLTLYDMLKAVDRGMRIGGIRVLEKAGGRTGHYRADKSAGRDD
jgi:cyclic pyranopterin phosphate synthase